MTLFGKRAATSLIPPTSTRMAPVSLFSASFSKDIVRVWFSQRNIQTPLQAGTQMQRAITARTWCKRWKRVSSGFRLITLTCIGFTWDQITPVEEVMRALDDLVRQGKVLYVGIS